MGFAFLLSTHGGRQQDILRSGGGAETPAASDPSKLLRLSGAVNCAPQHSLFNAGKPPN